LPEDIRGLRILDVCAGGSDLTASLCLLGADAIALDPLFDDPPMLYYRRKLTFAKYFGIDPNDIDNQDLKAFEKRPSIMAFRSSIERDPKRYIKGFSHELPFEDSSFDSVLSYNGIIGVLDQDIPLLRKSADEAIRVIKPGGQIQLGARQGSQTYLARINTSGFVTELMTRDDVSVSDEFIDFQDSSARRLIISKL
jgi:ubiquinone/menaquinone biosynthesis C-methylase UbiE